MDILTRLENLENFVFAMSERIDRNQFYNNADTAGNRQSISNITPYTETKTAYIEDTEVIFEGVANGELTVYVRDSEGNYPNYTIERMGDIVKVLFEPLEYITTVTISLL